MGFWVASTKNGLGSGLVRSPSVAWRFCFASTRALCDGLAGRIRDGGRQLREPPGIHLATLVDPLHRLAHLSPTRARQASALRRGREAPEAVRGEDSTSIIGPGR